MAKVTMAMDSMKSVPSTGTWTWKDETNSLEFMSNNPNADRQDKRRRAKEGNKKMDRVASSVGKPGMRGRSQKGNQAKSPHPALKQKTSQTTVTLDYVKNVALSMLSVQSNEGIPETFEGILNTDEFDLFLMHLFNYFHCFFDKLLQEHKINTTTYIEPSLSEKKAFEESLVKIGQTEKLLGQAYCVLELGLGLEDHHHMACGKSRVSSTLKDRGMFETLYSFCAYAVHISFRRKDFTVIKKEIGRILRSDTFNPAKQVKKLPEGRQAVSYHKIAAALRDAKNKKFRRFRKQFINRDEKDDNSETKEEQPTGAISKMTPAEYRRLQPKRPAIKAIINQRSPAIVAILPSPKEEANWLFRRRGALSPNSLSKMGREPETEEADDGDMFGDDFFIDKKTFKIGIIGEPLNLFNEKTLTPLGANEEEEGEEGEEGKKQTAPEEVSQDKTPSPEQRLSRQQTAISTGTTDAAFVDEED
ncbi:protein phosphatase 1 regulatory subunit 36-like [Ylistrum balloti]|uniref:protein phosphatase 1 regulatory subunit 36-like n=1 Tax=Ylistrum balloti TaxID=509963 RepID=UPI002905CED5|nr:protein phosphatase 1 regulatory subunit 36-like [Ylistrum balloti]